jgi:Family of unknown function (DUF6518)
VTRTPATRIALIVVAGLLTGVLTQIGQGALPDDWSQLANAITPWLLVAFLVGSAMPDTRWAAAAGIGALLLALIGYYGMVQLRYGYGGGTTSWIIWGLGAVVGGPVFGVAGHWWRGPVHRRRAIALGLLAAVAIAEGAYNVLVVDHATVGVAFIVVGLLVPLVFGRSRDDRVGGYVALLPCIGLGLFGFVVFPFVVTLIAGIGL